jgi:hypothetical protein
MYATKTGECCHRLGRLGAQLSLHQHRLQELEEDSENMSNLIENMLSERTKQYFEDLRRGLSPMFPR